MFVGGLGPPTYMQIRCTTSETLLKPTKQAKREAEQSKDKNWAEEGGIKRNINAKQKL